MWLLRGKWTSVTEASSLQHSSQLSVITTFVELSCIHEGTNMPKVLSILVCLEPSGEIKRLWVLKCIHNIYDLVAWHRSVNLEMFFFCFDCLLRQLWYTISSTMKPPEMDSNINPFYIFFPNCAISHSYPTKDDPYSRGRKIKWALMLPVCASIDRHTLLPNRIDHSLDPAFLRDVPSQTALKDNMIF